MYTTISPDALGIRGLPLSEAIELALTFATEVGHFLDVVQRGEQSQATFDHAARVLQLTLGAYAAAEGHCVISLPEDPTQPGVPVGMMG